MKCNTFSFLLVFKCFLSLIAILSQRRTEAAGDEQSKRMADLNKKRERERNKRRKKQEIAMTGHLNKKKRWKRRRRERGRKRGKNTGAEAKILVEENRSRE